MKPFLVSSNPNIKPAAHVAQLASKDAGARHYAVLTGNSPLRTMSAITGGKFTMQAFLNSSVPNLEVPELFRMAD